MYCKEKVQSLEVFPVMADTLRGPKVIAFRLSDAQLKRKIEEFRQEYGTGKHGMVTWERFCTFLGYSVADVRECYQRGMDQSRGKNAYYDRAKTIEAFYDECKAMMFETAHRQQQSANKRAMVNHLAPDPEDGPAAGTQIIVRFDASAQDCAEDAE